MYENNDFKNFILYGVLGRLTPGIQFAKIIELLGKPESIGESHNQFTSLTYGNLVLYINNDNLYSFEVYFNDCLEDEDRMLRYWGLIGMSKFVEVTFKTLKHFLEITTS
jgi:hypothetical protein